MREIIKGTIQGNERGYGFLIAENKQVDYFISHGDLRGAQHGDTVLCEATSGTGARTTARVLKILERGVKSLVGTYRTSRSGGFVVPDDKRYFTDIFIRQGSGTKSKNGDKVICKILAYPKKLSPEGIVTKVLGKSFSKSAELKSILFNYRLPEGFSDEVTAFSERLSEVGENDIKGRLDLRNTVCFTVDGEDSKDFDDAVSIEKTQDGNYILGVHIADVTHYVRQGDIIDKEAFSRATSVYFPESVIPMLPERLSNDLCSLKENTDRLTLSCIMTVNDKGKVLDYQIRESVIKSKKRLTYSVVQKILDGDKSLRKRYEDVCDSLLVMDELRGILQEKRRKEGSVDLDVKESVIVVDADGKIDVSAQESDRAHNLIEEFMILANTTVAEFAYYSELPFIYRVHEKPDQEKLKDFYAFLEGLGVKVKRKKEQVYPKDFQLILDDVKEKDYFVTVNRVMLRSMQKAKYLEKNSGHFGLALKNYCHFTSPIRRYPDLIVHRILKDFIKGDTGIYDKYSDFVVRASAQSSEKERNAIEVERAVDDYYKMLYIKDYIGQEFEATISGVTQFGVFAELDNGIEGLIKLENLSGEGYTFNKKTYTLTDGDKTFRLGNRIKIAVVGVDTACRRAEFLLCE